MCVLMVLGLLGLGLGLKKVQSVLGKAVDDCCREDYYWHSRATVSAVERVERMRSSVGMYLLSAWAAGGFSVFLRFFATQEKAQYQV